MLWDEVLATNLTPFKSLINFEDFLRSLNGVSGRALHLVHKVDEQIARCNNSQIKILNLFEIPTRVNCLDIKSETANDVLPEQNASRG